ncbi:MAG: hypothetical protein HY291_00070 [Planctomycetes bacterium]|nr:hypothetical protein [Planctomycetota bacterium]
MASSICVSCHRPAVAHCYTCHKPVCKNCAVKSGEGSFCSSACAENYAKFNARYKGEGRSSFLLKLVKLTLLLAILAGAGVFVAAKVLQIPYFVELLKKLGF